MTQVTAPPIDQGVAMKRKVAFGVTAVFITQFVSFLFINARNIATPQIIAEFDGMSLFAWLIALPALTGSISTLLFGKLSDIYGRRAILLLCIGIFLLGLGQHLHGLPRDSGNLHEHWALSHRSLLLRRHRRSL